MSQSRTVTVRARLTAFVACALVSGSLVLAPPAAANEETTESLEVTATNIEMLETTLDQEYVKTPEVLEHEGEAQQKAAVQLEPQESENDYIARADLNSPVAIVGASWDPAGVEPQSVSVRTLTEGTWSEWHELEIGSSSNETNTPKATEPYIATNCESVELVAFGPEGKKIPGIVLTVVDPEAQAEAHDPLADLATETTISSREDDYDEGPQVAPEDPSSSEDGATPAEIEETNDGELVEDTPPSNVQPVPDEQSPQQDVEQTEFDTEELTFFEQASFTSTLPSSLPASLSSDGTSFNTGVNNLVIKTRKAWGANPAYLDLDPESITIQGAVVHHTAGSNNYSQAQVPSVIRGIYYYHAVTLGWGDIGYNLLVDNYGGVWEGRAGGLTKGIKGAHAYGANSETFGISVLGDFTNYAPKSSTVDSLAKAIAWKLGVHGVPPTGHIRVPGSNLTGKNIERISGHRDVGATTCPGQAFYDQLPSIRNKVRAYMNTSSTPVPSVPVVSWLPPKVVGTGWSSRTLYPGDWNRDGYGDLMHIDSQGILYLYPGKANNTLAPRTVIGIGWQDMNWLQSGLDWNNDGNNDILTRHKNGNLYLYPGNGKGGFKPPKLIGISWTQATYMALVNTAQGPAIYANINDTLYSYPANGKGGFKPRQTMGQGWNGINLIAGVGDWNNDNIPDIIARRTNGTLYLYQGKTNGLLGSSTLIGTGWNTMTSIGSVNQTKPKQPLWTTHTNTNLYTYPIK